MGVAQYASHVLLERRGPASSAKTPHPRPASITYALAVPPEPPSPPQAPTSIAPASVSASTNAATPNAATVHVRRATRRYHGAGGGRLLRILPVVLCLLPALRELFVGGGCSAYCPRCENSS